MSKTSIRLCYALTLIFILFSWWYGAQYIKEQQPLHSGLPYFGNDTIRTHDYKVKKFEFLNQDSQLITRLDFENKIWVSEFFFSTCDGICPVMNMNLARIQDSFRSDTNVLFLSHTVDPTTDDVTQLKSYADRHNYIKGKWHFVTGKEAVIYDLARTSYFSATPRDSSLGEDFVHSQLMCLVDPHLHIRGYYDGTNTKDMKNLVRDIRLLEIEYEKVYRERNWVLKLLD